MNVKYRLILSGLLLFFAVSCGKYQKLLKSTDNDLKYTKAMAYYEQGDYYRALQLFDQLIPIVRGTEKAELMHYYYANSHYEQGDYVLASYYFKRFARNFPSSTYAEEASL
jgi:outer membrane protein assembly factor BamD